jgi:adenylate cyclase
VKTATTARVPGVHRGRVVKRAGDGVPAEFRSTLDAVRCAIEVQSSFTYKGRAVDVRRVGRELGVR